MIRLRGLLLVLFLLMIVPSISAQEDSDDEITVTDGVKHSVPLDKIIFDNFDNIFNRALPYSEATPEQIESLRDRIRPLCHGEIGACFTPIYESAEEASEWLSNGSMVIGYVDDDGQAHAYPFKILNYHEIVNDTLAGEPVLISYCPLCNSAIVFSRVVNGEELIFGNTSALYESDLVMYDTQTESYWYQVGGEAILGPLTTERLEVLPATVATWEQWKGDHPETKVLERPTDGIDYTRNVFAAYDDRVDAGEFVFPVSEEIANDGRLLPATNVLVVQIEDEAIAYPLAHIGDAAISDTAGGQEIVVLSREDGPAGAAYLPKLEDDTAVNLIYDDNVWKDTRTGSTFDLSGRATDGPLEGEQLVPVPTRYTFWFAVVASVPNIQVYSAE